MLPESYYEPDWTDPDYCDDPDCYHDDACTFCYEPIQHCECE